MDETASTATPSAGSTMLNDETFQHCMQVLEQHCADAQQKHEFATAKAALQELERMQRRQTEAQREEVQAQHLKELAELEKTQEQTLEQFNLVWDSKNQDNGAHAEQLRLTLEAWQANELQVYRQKLEAQLVADEQRQASARSFGSRVVLELRRKQDALARIKHFDEAQQVKAEADEALAREAAEWRAKRVAKHRTMEEQFVQKQRLEMSGLLKRIHLSTQEHVLAREEELKRLRRRFDNSKAALLSRQKRAQNRMDRSASNSRMPGLPSTPSMSRSMSRSSSVSSRRERDAAPMRATITAPVRRSRERTPPVQGTRAPPTPGRAPRASSATPPRPGWGWASPTRPGARPRVRAPASRSQSAHSAGAEPSVEILTIR